MGSPADFMGFHLQADVRHDFGPAAPTYNINGDAANTRVGARTADEDGAVSFFLDGAGSALIANLNARKAGQIIFTVPDKTASFQNWKAPVLYEAGNDKIGIIQDAGEFITTRLGSMNVITFGSILDPAGKPIRRDQMPIWFQPSINDTTIPLASYGFDTTVIQGFRVKDLTAGTVKASFLLGNGVEVDGVSMSAGVPTKAKPINNTKVEFAGFFTSINKAENISEELSIAGVSKSDAAKIVRDYSSYFYIGKTLGDASLVASGLSEFIGNDFVTRTPNPFNGTNGAPGQWTDWLSPSQVTSPTILALKTGDRLNWLRAIIMNLATIYEDQAKGARKSKQYKFFPGIADPASIREAILGDFDKMKIDAATRYNNLRLSILNELMPGGTLIAQRTSFAPGGNQVIKTNTRENVPTKLATQLLIYITSRLITLDGNTITGGVCKSVIDWIEIRKQAAITIPNLDTLTNFYSETLSKTNACCPQATSLVITKGKQEPYLTMKLIVASVPVGAAKSPDGWPLGTSLDISLRNAFDKFSRATQFSEPVFEQLLQNTDIYNRFISKIVSGQAGGGQRGGEVPLDVSSIDEFVTEVTGEIEVEESDTQSGGAYLAVSFTNMGSDVNAELGTILLQFPRIKDFIEYMMGKGVSNPQILFLSIYDVVRRRNTNRIIDSFLADELTFEFMDFVGMNGGTPYISIPNGDPGIFNPEYMYADARYPSSTSTLLFNAYTYSVNARNAYELTNTVQNQSDIDFQTFEAAYLSKIPTKISRITGQVVLKSDSFQQQPFQYGAGARPRRPLYSNIAVKRAKTRRNRKSKRKSKTR